MKYRIEKDSMGEINVQEDKLWGAQTQRSLENFQIGKGYEHMPKEVIHAFGIIKKACAITNSTILLDKMTQEKNVAICKACDEIINNQLNEHFPLVVWQTGSGTQTNMNVNEVIANRANQILGKVLVHPNDDVNMSQSSNDVFPTSMHISSVLTIKNYLLPELKEIINSFIKIEKENEGIVKIGRTHLQDAIPITFSQEVSGWRSSLEKDLELIEKSLDPLYEIALGATAVGTGLNAPIGFAEKVANEIANITLLPFKSSTNKFHSLTSKDELVFAHGALKALACDLMKIANDIRWLASGPRCGLGEIYIPENEPGSSIMPGKVNPTQCEAVTMVATQVMGNDVTIGLCASQGNFELNVYMPVCIYNYLQSVRLLAEVIKSFNENCIKGIKVNKEKMHQNLHSSLMLATALNPHIGYEKVAVVVNNAFHKNITIKESCIQLGYLTEEQFDEIFKLEKMI